MNFKTWLDGKLGSGSGEDAEIVVLDLSLVPTDVLHIIIAVIGRVLFESLQRYKKLNGYELPTVMVLEEAHTFVRRYSGSAEQDHVSPARMCRETFERIAREGRKFGLGLVLCSQRPAELSPTALSQCNTFLLHRIVNDADQDLVSRLVPDNLGGLLQELPTLPTRHAMLLGLATSIPLLVEMRELMPGQRPKSADPKFWAVWTGEEEREVDWESVADDWTGGA
jgi:DNA helicase HerA-like ATPase